MHYLRRRWWIQVELAAGLRCLWYSTWLCTNCDTARGSDRELSQTPRTPGEVLLQTHCLLGHHDLDELLVVDLAVTVNVGLADHLIDLLVGELLTEVGHDVTKL